MYINRNIIWFICLSGLVLGQSCDKEVPELYSIQDEILLADELRLKISEDSTFQILPQTDYALSYTYAQQIFESIVGLNNPDSVSPVANVDVYQWEILLLNEAEINAFVTPGGKVYINTGLVKILANADEFAAMLAHLINHSDQRHVTKRLLNFFSSKELLNASKGVDDITLDRIANNLFGKNVAFTFSLGDEQEADDFTVISLSKTEYACNGAIGFYQKLNKQEEQGNQPDFFVAHSNYDSRLENINLKAFELSCSIDLKEGGGFTYQNFKNSLP
ncbi:MAG: putative Zn-dependent protease [Cyclobacteriaceae bacterium]|jgi:predicted Zn-dependent protease